MTCSRFAKDSAGTFPRGDMFETILIQVKGGNARWPSDADIVRLRAVANRYTCSAILGLAEHKSGTKPAFYRLNRSERGKRSGRNVDGS